MFLVAIEANDFIEELKMLQLYLSKSTKRVIFSTLMLFEMLLNGVGKTQLGVAFQCCVVYVAKYLFRLATNFVDLRTKY